MNTKKAILILIVIALAAGLWAAFGRSTSELTSLVPAWRLTPLGAHDAQSLVDPVVSWSPDSRSLLYSNASTNGYRAAILRWKVGEKQAERIGYGVSPNYVDNNTFLFFAQNPKSVREHNLSTGKEREVVQNLSKSELWREIAGFSYNPAHKTIEIRISNFTQYYEPGCEEFDFTGKSLGNIPRTTGGGILDRSADPKGDRSAVIWGDMPQEPRELRITAPGAESKSKPVASGNLGAVAWSPDAGLVAFSDANEVKVLKLSDMRIITIARFGAQPEPGSGACVCRLVWSPNGSYLAAFYVVPGEFSSNAILYVLDMTKIKW